MTLEQLKPLLIEVLKKTTIRRSSRRPNEKDTHTYYRARCIVEGCSNETLIQKSKLKKVSGKCYSCANKKRPYEWAFSKLKARNKNVRFKGSHITYEETLKLMAQNKCEYCGIDLNRKPHIENDKQNPLLIDRKDSSQGYNYSNCVSACWKCNEMKRDFYSYEEFKAIVALLKGNFNW